MSRSDQVKTAPDVRFKPAGVGLDYSMRCGKCNGPMRNLGRRLVRHRGAKVWAGPCCIPQEKA